LRGQSDRQLNCDLAAQNINTRRILLLLALMINLQTQISVGDLTSNLGAAHTNHINFEADIHFPEAQAFVQIETFGCSLTAVRIPVLVCR
jgi:hypothetical protein